MRGIILAAFLLGVLGTAAELLLVNHTENFWQSLPVWLIGLSLLLLVGCVSSRRRAVFRAFQAVMVLFMASGAVGMFLHFEGKAEFKKETDPSLTGWKLFVEAMKGAMPPALAPAAMIQFGLLGLAYVHRHPVLLIPSDNKLITESER